MFRRSTRLIPAAGPLGRRRSTAIVGALAAMTLVLAACSGPGASTGTGADTATGAETATGARTATVADGACPSAVDATPLDQLATADVLADPRGYVGPSTACLASDTITTPDTPPAQQLPVTITDNQGTDVTVTDTSRILALDMTGTLSATVFALGLGDSVVGRDTSTGFAQAADLPEVTQGGHQLSGEAILDLSPTVIISDTSIGPWDVLVQMREAGIPVVILTPERSLDNVGTIVTGVADALGIHDAGVALAASLEQQVAATTAQIDALAPADPADRVRMLFLYVRGNAGVYYVFGAESGADALITSLAGIDVAAEAGISGMRPLTAEGLVAAAPDLILVMTKGLESVDGVDGLLERVPSVAQTPAGEHRRIVDMSDYDILSFGPRSAAVLDALARAIYAPEAQ